MRRRWVQRNGELIEITNDVAPVEHGVMIRQDSMNAIVSHADGKRYDSKSSYYKSLKQNGCRIIEKGEKPVSNFENRYKPDQTIKRDLIKTMSEYGMRTS